MKHLLILAGVLAVAGCGPGLRRGDGFIRRGEWLRAVSEYRNVVKDQPGNIEARSRLKMAELNAAEHYHAAGERLRIQGKLEEAVAEFQTGLLAMPENDKLLQALASCLAEREAIAYLREAATLEEAGNLTEARRLLVLALESLPDYGPARSALARLMREAGVAASLVLTSRSPVSLRFSDTDLRTAFDFLGKSFGLNMIFDEGIRNTAVTILAKDVTFAQALNLLTSTTQTFSKQIGPNTLLIAPDTPAKREQYEDLVIRTFPLNSVKASDMATMLKSVLNLKHVTVNDTLNTVIVRDTEDVLGLTEKIILANDRKPAEVILDVEILEINRTRAEQLGLNYGGQVSASFPATTIQGLTSGGIRDLAMNASLTLPSVVFNFFKQDVNAKVLANPKVRVIDRKAARIHIGDRVPLRTSTIQDATGQVRVTFDYKEIGIKVETTPTVSLDRSVVVKLNLEISTLGANLGTQAEPAYSIGTRNADTMMLLRDGETAVLGGLIRDEERRNRINVPGIGNIPVVGALLTTAADDSNGRTDVLLTVTPHVVRPWDVPPKELREVFSGTEGKLSGRKPFATLAEMAEGAATPVIAVNRMGATGAESSTPAAGSGTTAAEEAGRGGVQLAFAEAQYEVKAGQEIDIVLTGANLGRLASLPLVVAFNPQLLQYVDVAGPPAGIAKIAAVPEPDRGFVRLALTRDLKSGGGAAGTLATLKVRGVRPGVSYLVFINPVLKDSDGRDIRAQARASRIVVR